MTQKQARNWLGIGFFLLTLVVGVYTILFGDTSLLPVSESDATSAFQIIIPVCLSQLAIMAQWFTGEQRRLAGPGVPSWLVWLPLLGVSFALIFTVIMMVVGNSRSAAWTHGPKAFKSIVTFCVALINATSAIVITRYFRAPPAA